MSSWRTDPFFINKMSLIIPVTSPVICFSPISTKFNIVDFPHSFQNAREQNGSPSTKGVHPQWTGHASLLPKDRESWYRRKHLISVLAMLFETCQNHLSTSGGNLEDFLNNKHNSEYLTWTNRFNSITSQWKGHHPCSLLQAGTQRWHTLKNWWR